MDLLRKLGETATNSPTLPSTPPPPVPTISSPPSSSQQQGTIRSRVLDSPGGLRQMAQNLESEAEKNILNSSDSSIVESEHSQQVREDMSKLIESMKTGADLEQNVETFRSRYGGRDRVEFVRSEEGFYSPPLIRLLLSRLSSAKGKNLRMVFGVLWILARAAKNKITIASQHGIEATVQALASSLHLADVQLAGIAVLLNVSSHDERCAQLAASEGAIAVVVAAMQTHSNNAEMQEQGSAALTSFSIARDNCGIILKEGGVEVIIRAMTAHKTSEGVQNRACSALKNLAFSDSLVTAIVWAHGVEAVIGAMESHVESVDVNHRALMLLMNLLTSEITTCADAVRIQLSWQRGIRAVVRSLRTHASVVPVAFIAVQLLGTLCKKSRIPTENTPSPCILLVLWEGGIDAILAVWRIHMAIPDFSTTVAQVLFTLAQNPAAKVRIVQRGGKELTLAAAKQHVDHVVVAKSAHQLHSAL